MKIAHLQLSNIFKSFSFNESKIFNRYLTIVDTYTRYKLISDSGLLCNVMKQLKMKGNYNPFHSRFTVVSRSFHGRFTVVSRSFHGRFTVFSRLMRARKTIVLFMQLARRWYVSIVVRHTTFHGLIYGIFTVIVSFKVVWCSYSRSFTVFYGCSRSFTVVYGACRCLWSFTIVNSH